MDEAEVRATFDGIGRFGRGERGFSRLVFGEAESEACAYVAEQMRAAGLAVRADAFGNLIGRREGTVPDAPAVATGSHLDTVPEGGNFDGVVGVVAGLAALRRLAAQPRPRHPVELIVFRGEESSRFSVGTMGSKVMAGLADGPAWRALKDHTGVTLAEALAARGLALDGIGAAARRPQEFGAFVEVHIEQGPVLESLRIPIGVVEAIAAPVRLQLTVRGTAAHSGTTPMGARRDALVTAARIVLAVQDEAHNRAERRIVGTVGVLQVHPGALNVVPGRVELWVDVRGIDEQSLREAGAAVEARARAIAEQDGVALEVKTLGADRPVPMDPVVIGTIEAACKAVRVPCRRMPSGAGHDAMNLARLCPAGMIFIPCRGGISHNPDEHAELEDVLRGIEVLTETLRRLAA
jgi:beta-ureidopropionase / N-carbamoyl-L-amino-acid hydrolase